MFRYQVDDNGNVYHCGYIQEGETVKKSDPFTDFDILNYKKDIANNEWVLREELLWKYFLIPLDLVPYISHYADFVKEAYPELIFDVVVESRAIEVEGTSVIIPHKQIKVIPCSCTHWSDEGLELLDAVIENWNVTYPDKQINFQVAFESFEEFENFRNEQIIIA